MTTFTSEDLENARHTPWDWSKAYQTPIQFFWPLTEQIPLDLDYTPSIDYIEEKRKQQVRDSVVNSISFVTGTWTTNISPQFTVHPQNSVGELNIGSISIGLEKKPSWIQRQFHKLLGFNWKDLK